MLCHNMTEVMSIKPDLWPRTTRKYIVRIIETFALTTNMASIRLLLQIAVQLLIHHMDVKSACPLRL